MHAAVDLPPRARLPGRVVSIAFPDGLLEQVESVRGGESRSSFVARAIRAELARLAAAAERLEGAR